MHHPEHNGAGAPGSVAPELIQAQKDEAPGRPGTEGFREQKNRHRDSGEVAPSTSSAKAFTTLQARAARAGWQLLRMPDGELVALRWNRSIELPDLAAVESFLAKVGGNP